MIKHPYKAFEGKSLWKQLDRGISELVQNGDLIEKTPREYIIGYLCKLVTDQKKIKD